LIALPIPAVLASFPNTALSFIRVAIFFLQGKLVIYDSDAKASACAAYFDRLLSKMFGTSLALC
jgi:hypothetical protein